MEYDIAAWDRNPEPFYGPDEYHGRVASNMVEAVMRVNPSGILDIGCANGRYLRWLRELGYKGLYVGMDVTPAFVKKAQERSPLETFILGDVRNLVEVLENTRYEMVACLNVFMHLPSLNHFSDLFIYAKRYVAFSIYGSDKGIEENHGHGFLNFWYPKEEIESRVPKGWKVKEFHRIPADWDVNRPLWQYIWERE